MAGSHSTTDFATMAKTATEFESNAADLDAMLTRLKGEVETLLGGWAGNGATAFQGVMVEFGQSQTSLNNQLKATAELIRSAGTNYNANDAATATTFKPGSTDLAGL